MPSQTFRKATKDEPQRLMRIAEAYRRIKECEGSLRTTKGLLDSIYRVRNDAMVELVMEYDWRITEVARAFGLTSQRVHFLVQQAAGRYVKADRTIKVIPSSEPEQEGWTEDNEPF